MQFIEAASLGAAPVLAVLPKITQETIRSEMRLARIRRIVVFTPVQQIAGGVFSNKDNSIPSRLPESLDSKFHIFVSCGSRYSKSIGSNPSISISVALPVAMAARNAPAYASALFASWSATS